MDNLLQRLVRDWINASFSGCSNVKNMKNYNFTCCFMWAPKLCLSFQELNTDQGFVWAISLYSIILPKTHARVLKSGVYTNIYMFWPTVWSFLERQSTRMSTWKVKLLKYQNQSTHIILHFFGCRFVLEIALDHNFFDNFSINYISMNTLHLFCHYEPFLRPLYIAVPGHRVSRNSCNKVTSRMTMRKSVRIELILCTVCLILLVWYKPVTIRWVHPVLHIEGGEKCVYNFWS
jgi:hypothetical protein